ncbi:methyltransferase domain-containing protein [soil metagenome]
MFDRRLLRRNRLRSRHPVFLEELLAREIAQRLDEVLRDFETVLIHGHGAAAVAASLRGNPRLGRIIRAASISDPGIDIVLDAEALPFAPQSLSAIVSLLTIQSVNDLPGALIQMRQALRPDGMMLACLFAGSTLEELRRAWLAAESAMTGGASPRVAPFAELRDLGGLLQRAGFALPVADADRTVLRYQSAMALMREIKALGFGHALVARTRRPVTPGLLAAAASFYDRENSDADGKIRATIEVAWLTGWAPHDSQQRPLKPGSAQARLADALKTSEFKAGR